MGDSTSYFNSWLQNSVMSIRPSFYPFLLGISLELGSIYLLIAFQIILLAITLEILLVRCLQLPVLVGSIIVLGISITTTMAWFANMLMSDIFFGIGGICFFILAFYAGKLSTLEKYAVAAMLSLSMLTHIAMPVLMFSVAMLYLLIGLVIMQRPLIRIMAVLATASLLAWSCYSSINMIYGNTFTSSTGFYKFIASRLAGEGLIGPKEVEYLARDAPEKIEKLKGQFETIQGTVTPNYQRIQVFSHSPDSPFADWEEDKRLMGFKEMVKMTLKTKPLASVVAELEGAIRLWTCPTIPDFVGTDGVILGAFLEKPFPGYFNTFLRSRQARGQLNLGCWNSLIGFTYYLGLLTLGIGLVSSVLLAGGWRNRQNVKVDPALVFAIFIVILLLVHSVIIYFLSGDFPRYQARMSWLVSLAALCLAGALLTRKRVRR